MTAPIVNPLPYDNKTPLWLLHRAKTLMGNTFREILNADPYLTPKQKREVEELANSASSKWSLWHLIEENFFYYNRNPSEEADFPEAWVELKTSPYEKKSDWSLKAKERLVLTMINYLRDYDKTFEESHLHTKCKLMLLIYYYYEKNKSKLDYLINYVDLFQIPVEDLKIIKRDYYKIIQKIKDWKAHELSEWDTMYLWACTKWVDASSSRQQPFSHVMAKQRAFCLKNSYMTMILNEYLAKWIHTYHEQDTNEQLTELKNQVLTYWKAIKNADILDNDSFEDYIVWQMIPYYGMDAGELLQRFNIDSVAKSNYYMLAKKMLWVDEDRIEEFEKANIAIKTIRLKANWVPKEAMSFPAFKYMEIINQDFYDSDLYDKLSESKFLFMIFQYTDSKESKLIFKKAMFWNTPMSDINWKIKEAREETKLKISWWEYNNLIKISDDMIIHVRPHARNAEDTFPTPDWWKATKKCFWFNQKYIKEQIEKEG